MPGKRSIKTNIVNHLACFDVEGEGWLFWTYDLPLRGFLLCPGCRKQLTRVYQKEEVITITIITAILLVVSVTEMNFKTAIGRIDAKRYFFPDCPPVWQNPPENERGTNHTDDDLSLFAGCKGQLSNQFAQDLNQIYRLAKQIMEK